MKTPETTSTMRDRPIIFSGPMVKALLDGRKTQTRRVLKPKTNPWNAFFQEGGCCKADWHPFFSCGSWYWQSAFASTEEIGKCPYGQVGDNLFVRETFASMQGVGVKYRADNPGAIKPSEHWDTPWKSPLFMPRAYSRITLELVSVRVERLQEITEEDAKAEGCHLEDWRETSRDPMSEYGQWLANDSPPSKDYTFRNGYRRLWDLINAKKHPWAENCFVWILTFKRIKP